MCLVIDRRESSRPAGKDLISYLRRYDIELAEMELDFGDAMFGGHGERGDCTVAIEHKRLADLVTSMKDRRLAGHQLRGLWQTYDYVFLVVEGTWRPGPGGEIEELRGKEWRPFFGSRDRLAVNYRQLVSYLNSLSLRSKSPDTGEPLRVIRTNNPRQTAAEYAALYYGFTEKEWSAHHAHDQIYTEITLPTRRVGLVAPKITTLWKMAAQIDGIDRKAEAVAKFFKTPQNMANAGEKEWRRIDGVGIKIARQAVKVMQEEEV